MYVRLSFSLFLSSPSHLSVSVFVCQPKNEGTLPLCVQVCESIKIPLEKKLKISQNNNGASGADNNNNSNNNDDSNSSCRLQLTAESKIKRLHKVQA